jgi:nucleoside-diphosphate-sugar epimerase
MGDAVRVLVTGASGFIGRIVCERLIERGDEVYALVRRTGSEPPRTRALAGDLAGGSGVDAAVASARPDCVVHLAAEIASQRSARKLLDVNVGGTERLLAACLAPALEGALPAPRVVFCSTVVTGDAGGELLSEDRPLPVSTPYGRSKQQGERLLLDSGLPAVVVRPSHVYGPGGWYAQELLARLRQPGRFAVIGSGRNLWDVVHVEDVVGALLAATAPGVTSGSIYHIVDDEPISFYDFMALSASALGTGPPRRIPVALARAVAGRNAVDAAVRSARSSNAKIKRELGLQLRFPTAREGVPATIAALAG